MSLLPSVRNDPEKLNHKPGVGNWIACGPLQSSVKPAEAWSKMYKKSIIVWLLTVLAIVQGRSVGGASHAQCTTNGECAKNCTLWPEQAAMLPVWLF